RGRQAIRPGVTVLCSLPSAFLRTCLAAHPSMPALVARRSSLVARWYLWLPAALVVVGVLVPLGYLVVRAFDAEAEVLASLVFRARNLRLLGNTAALTAAVLALTTALALPLAWLVTRTDLGGRRVFTLLGV